MHHFRLADLPVSSAPKMMHVPFLCKAIGVVFSLPQQRRAHASISTA